MPFTLGDELTYLFAAAQETLHTRWPVV